MLLQAVADKVAKLSEFARTPQAQTIINLMTIEAIACILAVKNDIVPPTINHFTDDPELDNKLNFTFHTAQKRTVNVALSNTFGFGGHNTSVIVKKFKG